MELKQIGASVLASLIVVAGVLWVANPKQGPTGPQGPQGPQGIPGEQSLGALSSPDISSPYLSWGNVRDWRLGQDPLNTGTTSLCAIQTPAATSTLVSATLRIATLPYAVSVEISNATTAHASTTRLGARTMAATSEGFLVASTTTNLPNGVVFPNSYINFRVATSAAPDAVNANFQPTGKCSVVFREI